MDLFGLSAADYRRKFLLLNLLPSWPGKSGKGDAFPLAEARRRAGLLRPRLRGRRVVLLGKNVARAFGLRADFLRWEDAGGFEAAVLPHPSGVNLWWNDPANRERARRFARRLARGTASFRRAAGSSTPR